MTFKYSLFIFSFLSLLVAPAFAVEGDKKEVKPVVIELPRDVYEKAVRQTIPMSPKQLKNQRQQKEALDRAQTEEIKPVIPVISSTTIPAAGLKKPIVLRLRVGYQTTLVFQDAIGQPFKVKPSNFGDQNAYTKEQKKDHVITLFATEKYRATNFSVYLDGEKVPLVFHLVNGGVKVDYIRTIVVPKVSPNSRKQLAVPISDRDVVPVVNDENLTTFLDNLPPSDAQVIPSMDQRVQSWWYKSKMIIRTRLTLVSPDGVPLHGNNGWRVYEVSTPLSTLVFIDNGQQYLVHVSLDQVNNKPGAK